MDQKHAMLYPDPNSIPSDQRSSAAAAIGLPVEAPPSYDVAITSPAPAPNVGWMASAPPASTNYNQIHQHPHNVPVVVEQPRYPQAIPNQPTVPPRQSHESTATTG